MKAVVLFSGGIDSTTLLSGAVKTYGAENVAALTLFYGQKHHKELESAKAVSEHFGVQHIIKDIAEVFSFDTSNPLLGRGEMPEGDYATQQKEADGLVKTYVPYRNGLFLSYATAIAYTLGAEVIFYGAHADDAAGNAYPDCSTDFYETQAAAIEAGTGGRVRMEAPLINMNKQAVVEMGLDIDTPYHLTWSCYNGTEVACGKCGTCIDRQKAFEANGTKDPIPYA